MTETILITGANRGIGLALTEISLISIMVYRRCLHRLPDWNTDGTAASLHPQR